jgi:hypothetical protein
MSSYIKSANDLRVCSRNTQVIKSEVREILKAIEVEAVNANKDGRNAIDFAVPKTYSTIGEDPESILTLVTTIIKELKSAGYKVKLKDINHSWLFTIRWITDLTMRDKRKMLELLKEHMADSDSESE